MCALRPVPVFAVVGLMLPVVFAQEYAFYSVSDSPPNSLGCHVACLPSGATVTAWEESPGGVYTRLLAGELQATIYLGAGHAPVVCTRADAFLLAYADGSVVRLRQGDGTSWGGVQTVQGGGTAVSLLDIAAAPAGGAVVDRSARFGHADDRLGWSRRARPPRAGGRLSCAADLGERAYRDARRARRLGWEGARASRDR